jgi:hypothetical protein
MGNRVILTCIRSTIPHQHMHRINLKSIALSKQWVVKTPKFAKWVKVWASLFWSFRTKPLSVQENVGTLLLAFLFLIMIFRKVRSTWSHAAKLNDPVASNSFSASQAEALDVEILLSSQGSRIVSVKKSSIVYSFLVCASNPQNRTRKYAQDRPKL